jgi:hypothetical protein
VNSIEHGKPGILRYASYDLVRQKHEVFDQTMAIEAFSALNFERLSAVPQYDTGLR